MAVLPESLGLGIAEPSVRLSMLTGGVAEAADPVTLTTRWNVEPSRSKVVVYAYLEGAPGPALAVAPGPLASGATSSSQRNGLFAPTAESCGSGRSAGPGMEVVRQALTPGVSRRSSRTDALQLFLQSCSGTAMTSVDDRGTLTFLMQAY